MHSRNHRVSPTDFAARKGVEDWRFALGRIRAEFRTGSYSGAAALVAAIADLAEAADHHPDLSLRYPDVVRVALSTHTTGGLSEADVALAQSISGLVAERGHTSRPDQGQAIELAIDTMDAEAIRPFWAAVLDYAEVHGNLEDPRGEGPALWFQQMDEPRTDRNRFHLDVSVPHDQADARIEAALAAGGRLVSDARARAFWVLADADGNECCVCTWQDRPGPNVG